MRDTMDAACILLDLVSGNGITGFAPRTRCLEFLRPLGM